MKKIVVLLIVLALVFWLWQQERRSDDVQDKKISQPNVVSFVGESGGEKKAQHKNSVAKKQTKEDPLAEVKIGATVADHTKANEWTYLATYRRWEQAVTCRNYYWYLNRNKDKGGVEFVNDTYELKAQQFDFSHGKAAYLESLKAYQNQCDQVRSETAAYLSIEWNEMEGQQDTLPETHLWQLLSEMKPETTIEQVIAQQIQLNEQVKTGRKHLAEVRKSVDQLSDAEMTAMQDQLGQLYRERKALSEQMDAQHALTQLNQINAEIEAIELKKQNRYNTSGPEYAAAKQQLLLSWQAVQANVKSQNPDVFLLAKTMSEWASGSSRMGIIDFGYLRNELLPGATTPGERLMQLMGVADASYFQFAANPAALLYLCTLGHDCSANSQLSYQMCLGLNGFQSRVEACGLDVESYLLNHHLSPNQVEDVLLVLEAMEVEYGS